MTLGELVLLQCCPYMYKLYYSKNMEIVKSTRVIDGVPFVRFSIILFSLFNCLSISPRVCCRLIASTALSFFVVFHSNKLPIRHYYLLFTHIISICTKALSQLNLLNFTSTTATKSGQLPSEVDKLYAIYWAHAQS